MGLAGLAACAANLPPATYDSVHYGPHERQVVDVWLPDGVSKPVPVVVNIHGGGFTYGERKERILEKRIPECRAAGVAVVSVEYRLVHQAGDVRPPVRICMDDVREAMRFIRLKAADWNLDLDRLVLSGGSAGGCAALYIALSDDNEFGVKAVYVDAPQTTLDPKVMRAWIPNSRYGHKLFGFDDFQTWYDKCEECREWILKYSAMPLLERCRADKIPVVIYTGPAAPPPGQLPKDPTHSGTFTQKFEAAARARGADCRRGTFADALDVIRHPAASVEPPAILAMPSYNKGTGEFRMDYNGHTLLQFILPPGTQLIYRRAPGAGILTTPLTEQITFAVNSKPVVAKMRWTLSPEAYCMRPRRARGDEAILGQVGVPLVFGVNGLYSLDEDLLVCWTDRNWRWTDAELRRDALGRLTAEMEVTLTAVPWVVNMRMRYYKEHMGYSYFNPWARKPKSEPVAGWCSWLAYHKNIDEGKILGAAESLSKKFAPYGLTHLQIDDGFQDPKMGITPQRSHAESWLDPTRGFPRGVTNTVPAIRGAGLHPAIWMNTDIKVYERKKGDRDIVFRSRDGSPLRVPLYVSQGTDAALEDTFAPLWRAFAGAGFEYIKIDGVRHTFYDGFGTAVRIGLISTEVARRRMRRLWETARTSVGENAFLLSCWGMQSESVGMVDGCRISTDTDTSWEKLFLQQYELARYWPLQRILFQLDPDHICARSERPWAVATLSTVSLCGGLFMISDPVDAYTDSLAHDIQRALPPLPTRPAETAPIDLSEPAYANHRATYKVDAKNPLDETNSGVFENREGASPFGTLWAHHFAKNGRRWAVVHRTALFSIPATKIPLKNLGLNPAKRYAAFDFWQGRFIGTANGVLDMSALAAGNSQTVIMHEEVGHPAFLASSRHVGGGYVELEKEEWNAQKGVLNLTFTPQPEAVTAYVYCPAGFCPQKGAATQEEIVTITIPASDRRQTAAVKFGESRPGRFPRP